MVTSWVIAQPEMMFLQLEKKPFIQGNTGIFLRSEIKTSGQDGGS